MSIKQHSILLLYVWLTLFGLLPLLLMLITSTLTPDINHWVKLPFTMQHYVDLMHPNIISIFCRSLLIALLTTVLCLLLAFPVSYWIVKSRNKSVCILLIIIPFWTSSLVRTYALLALFKYKGVLNTILLYLHCITTPLSLLYSNTAVIIGLVYTLFPFMVLPLFASMERFDYHLIEAAQDLGASRLTIFWRIFVPMNRTGIISGCILVLLPAMTIFYIPNVLGGARSLMLGNLIQNQFLLFENWPAGSATSVMLSFCLLSIIWIYHHYNKGIFT